MATHRKELVSSETFNFTPTTLEEAQKYATIFANSGICPEAYRGRPNDILIVWQMGEELGLKKMQALRTLGCINGMPFAYGDGLLALVKRHPDFENIKEWTEGDLNKGTLTAYCTITRKGQEPVTQSFSMEDARRAGLWGKKGPWTFYPKRMLQHRARGFTAKDAFPDAIFGLMSEEEAKSVVESKQTDPQKIKGKGISGLEETLGVAENEIIEGEVILENEERKPMLDVSDENIPHQALSLLDELIALIRKHQIHGTSIKNYLKRCKVKKLKELSEEQIVKWINHLKNKESK